MIYIKYILIGALIGYCTNYLAIKMLFRPRSEKRILGFKIPFTPGVIPKNQPRIARAIASMVSKTLLTKEDVIKSLEGLKPIFVNKVMEVICAEETSVNTLSSPFIHDMDEKIANFMLHEIDTIDFTHIIQDVMNHSLSGLLNNPMISMFLSKDKLDGIYSKVAQSLRLYLQEHGMEVVLPIIRQKLEQPLYMFGFDEEKVRSMVSDIYDSFIDQYAIKAWQALDVESMIARKIEAMDMAQLEDLVMSVMKNELQAVINLGAILGALIGMLNSFL